jgi:parvulin-like peptidyl-prolyl isomerase
LITLCLAASGCGLQKGAAPATVLHTRDFIADPTTSPTELKPRRAAAPAPPETPAPTVIPAPLPTPTVTTPEAARGGVDEVTIVPGEPAIRAGVAPAEPAVLVDSKVGEINGSAVRAGEILDDRSIGPRLEAAAKRTTLGEEDSRVLAIFNMDVPPSTPMTKPLWESLARALIAIELNTELETELLEGEARASLKPEQQQGLRYLVQEISENARRAEGGSAEALRPRQGWRRYQQGKREQVTRFHIDNHHAQEIDRRVHVTWKDVQLFYDRNTELFNPPPAATFRLIRIPAEDTAAVEKVRSALAQPGARFEQVASDPTNQYLPDQGGLYGPKPFRGDYASGQFFADPLNAAALALKPGQWSDPVDFQRDKAWIYLESITQTHRPLSDRDVQLEIVQRLTQAARQAELKRYMQNLKSRSRVGESSDIMTMTETLVRIAEARYWPGP